MTVLDHRIELGSPTGAAGTGVQEYTANVFVDCDDCKDTGHTVLQYLITEGFDYGAEFRFGNDHNPKARLYQIENPTYVPTSEYTWRVTLRYREFRLLVGTGSTNGASPEDFQPRITGRTVGRSEPVESAIYRGGLDTGWAVDEERLVTNSAGVPFTPAKEADQFNRIIRVTRRTAAITFSDAFFPERWVNDSDFVLYNDFIRVPVGKHQLKFTGWEVDQEEYLGYDVVRVEFVGELKKEGWRELLLDRGTMVASCDDGGRRNDGRGGRYYSSSEPPNIAPQRNLLDRHGQPITEPVLLDGAGNALPPCSDEAFYGQWSFYDEIDPTSLGFFAAITQSQ